MKEGAAQLGINKPVSRILSCEARNDALGSGGNLIHKISRCTENGENPKVLVYASRSENCEEKKKKKKTGWVTRGTILNNE